MGVSINNVFGIDFLFDLGKSTCVLNCTIQLWNSVFMFSMEVRNITVYL